MEELYSVLELEDSTKLSLVGFYQLPINLDISGRRRGLSWRVVSIRLPYEQVFLLFSWVMIGTGGPIVGEGPAL